MKSLFNVKFNWHLFTGAAVIIFFLFPGLSMYSYFAILITLHQFLLLFYSFNFIIPIRYLFGAFMSLQMLLGPALAYNGLDSFQHSRYTMQIPEADYFTYVIPAVICFITGLHAWSNGLKGEFIDTEAIKSFVVEKKDLPYVFIGIGFVSSIIASFFSSELSFVFYLLAGFKFIGAFMLITGNLHLKIIPLIIVYGSIIFSSLGEGMFHDLLTWLIFLAAVLAIRYKPSVTVKALFTLGFIILSVSIQLIKGDYREATWERGEKTGLNTLSKAYDQSQTDNAFFSAKSLAQSNLRINQGFIITHIMKTVPKIVPFAEGAEMNEILVAALLPRFLVPDKLTAGNRDIFMKYTNLTLGKNTSMGLSSIGDAYINFGIAGGCLFMLLLGIFYSEILKAFYKYGKRIPVLLLFSPLVFYYPIRPDCELQTTLGHLIKSCFLIIAILVLWKKEFGFIKMNVWSKSMS